MSIREYTPAAYAAASLLHGYSAPQGFSANVELNGWAMDFSGHGYLAGTFPDGITSVEGVPGSAEIRILYRAEEVSPVDGALVAAIHSDPAGTWLVTGLNPSLKYDVICRHEGYNDMILSNVSPALATGLEFAGSFITLDDQVQILLGTGPYQIDVVGGTPPEGVSFTTQGNFIVVDGEPENFGQFTFSLRVIDSNGISGSFESMVVVEQPLPTEIGEPYGGGFYAGDIKYPNGQWYKLIVADKEADLPSLQYGYINILLGTGDMYDGKTNTTLMVSDISGFMAYSAVTYSSGGNDDWYIPAIEELKLLAVNLGPLTTDVTSFMSGGEQSFTATGYKASTEVNGLHIFAHNFGTQGYGSSQSKTSTDAVLRSRPIRRIPFTPGADG